MATDPQTLLSEAKCFMCFGVSEEQALELALLARIATNGIGGCVAPSAPTNLLISPASTNGNIILNWSQGSAPQTNQIWRSTDAGVTFTLLSTVAGTTTTFTDPSVIPVEGQWYYEVRGCNSTCCSAFTDPAGIFNTFSRTVNTGLVSFSFPFLQFVIGDFVISSQAATTTISVPRLHTVTGQLSANNDPVLSTLVTTSLKTCARVGVFANAALLAFNAPALTTVTDFFAVRSNTVMATLSVPLLSSVGTSYESQSNPALTSLSLPSLVSVGTSFDCSGSGITSLSLPVLTTIGSDFTSSVCPALASSSMPVLTFPDGFLVTFDSCILDVASVNQVLARGVASGTTASDYELNSPGNAAPAGQGLLDKATLIGAGNTVNTN